MRSTVRAYSHQGHGPRADHQAGYISATFRPHILTCEQQPVHTFSTIALRITDRLRQWRGKVGRMPGEPSTPQICDRPARRPQSLGPPRSPPRTAADPHGHFRAYTVGSGSASGVSRKDIMSVRRRTLRAVSLIWAGETRLMRNSIGPTS